MGLSLLFSCGRLRGIRRRPVGRRRRGRSGGGSLRGGGGRNLRAAPRGLIRSRRTMPPSNGFRQCRAPRDGLRRCLGEFGLDGRLPLLDGGEQPAQERQVLEVEILDALPLELVTERRGGDAELSKGCHGARATIGERLRLTASNL